MKKILFLLVMGVSGIAMASVVPSQPIQVKKPGVTGIDTSKIKIIRKEKPAQRTGEANVAKFQNYQGVLTSDNVDAMENMARLMQENPAGLMALVGAKDIEFEYASRPTVYPRTDRNATPAERLSNLQPPSLTASLPGVQFTKEDVRREQQRALEILESVGRKQLGEKQVTIAQPMSVEEIKKSGIDTSIFPEGWEEIMRKNQEVVSGNRRKQLRPASSKKTKEEDASISVSEEDSQKANQVGTKVQQSSAKKSK